MAENHRRNIGPMNAAPRCGARTRNGSACASPAISGKERCRLHGGKSTGAPRGNANALKHGLYTRAFKQKKDEVRTFVAEARAATTYRNGPRAEGSPPRKSE